MAKVYNKSGCLTNLIGILKDNEIYAFETLEDIYAFRYSYKDSINKIKQKGISKLKASISALEKECKILSSKIGSHTQTEKDSLKANLAELNEKINKLKKPKRIIEKILLFVEKRKFLQRKLKLEKYIEREKTKLSDLNTQLKNKKDKPQEWITVYTQNEIEKQEKIVSIFKEEINLFYGAEGEEKVIEALSTLPQNYTIINDYQLRFWRPIYDKRNTDRIYSIQIDHIVVGPTGIYLIETKNWSKESLENIDLLSPIKQLSRHSFAMFVLLNQAVKEGKMRHLVNHWGKMKISPRNIVCMINFKPMQQFQYVTVLTLQEITHYISRQKQEYTEEELEDIVIYLRGRAN